MKITVQKNGPLRVEGDQILDTVCVDAGLMTH